MEYIKGFITVILIIVSIVGILLVLMQSSKGGGGLFGEGGGSQSFIGSDRKSDFFTKLTSILIGIFIGGSFLLAYVRYQIDKNKPEIIESSPLIQDDKNASKSIKSSSEPEKKEKDITKPSIIEKKEETKMEGIKIEKGTGQPKSETKPSETSKPADKASTSSAEIKTETSTKVEATPEKVKDEKLNQKQPTENKKPNE